NANRASATEKDISSWAASITVGGTIANGDTVTVTVDYDASGTPNTQSYTVVSISLTGSETVAEARAKAASQIAAAINAGTPHRFYADVETDSNVINIFSATRTDNTTYINSVSKTAGSAGVTVAAVTNAVNSIELTGAAAVGKVWTVGVAGGFYSFVGASATDVSDVV